MTSSNFSTHNGTDDFQQSLCLLQKKMKQALKNKQYLTFWRLDCAEKQKFNETCYCRSVVLFWNFKTNVTVKIKL